MAEYKKFARPSGFRRPAHQGNNSSFKKELYDAECANCHKRCQVPFRPNGKKPVHCQDCFVKDDSRAPARYGSDDRKFAPRSARPTATPAVDSQIQDLNRQLRTMNETLERLAAAVESFSRASAPVKETKAPEAKEAPIKPAKKIAATKKATKVVRKK